MMTDDQAVLGLIEGLTEVFRGIWRMAELFWDLWKAWPRCLKVYEGWPSNSETNRRLDQRVWRDWMGDRAVVVPIKGLADVFEGIGLENELCWTYGGLGRRVWRHWMRARRVLWLVKGLADVFEGIGWEADVWWDLSKAWPTCLKGLHERPSCFGTYGGLGRLIWRDWMRARRVLRLMEGLADVFEGVGWEADMLWDLCRAWLTCLKGLDGRPTDLCRAWPMCYGTYGWLDTDVLWDFWMAWPTCLEGLDGKPTCSGTYDITKEKSRVAKEKSLFIFFDTYNITKGRSIVAKEKRLLIFFNILITLILVGSIRWC